MQSDISDFLETYPEPENIVNDLETLSKNISDITETKIKIESEMKHLGIRIEEIKNEISKAKMARDACKSVEELDRFREEMMKKEAAYEEAKTAAESDPLYPEVRSLFKNGLTTADITSSNRELSDFLLGINREFSKYKDCNIFKLQTNFNLFMTESTIKSILKKHVDDLDLLIETNESRLENLKTMRGLQQSYISSLKSLELRPANCVDNECPFIKEAYEHRDAPEQLKRVEAEISSTNDSLKDHRAKRSYFEDLIILEKEFAYKWEKVKNNPLIPLYCKINNLQNISNLISQETLESNLSKEISSFYNNLVEMINKLTVLANKQNSYLIISNDYEKIKNSNEAALREKYETEIIEANKKLDDLRIEHAKQESELSKIVKDLASEQNKEQQYKKYKHSKEAYSSFEEKQREISNSILILENLEREFNEAVKNETEINNQIQKLTADKFSFEADLLNVNSKITNVRSITERLEKLQKKFAPVE